MKPSEMPLAPDANGSLVHYFGRRVMVPSGHWVALADCLPA